MLTLLAPSIPSTSLSVLGGRTTLTLPAGRFTVPGNRVIPPRYDNFRCIVPQGGDLSTLNMFSCGAVPLFSSAGQVK
ncbi:MAG TPA: hypothetical protein VK735_05965 [Pseudonocardia sp.]|nr:hypothetical protein [Pseudonocardia sp.]